MRGFRALALAESLSWVALLAAVAAEHVLGAGEPTSVVGPVHGVLFLCWLGGVLARRDELGWDGADVLRAVLLSLVPFGAYAVLGRLSPVQRAER